MSDFVEFVLVVEFAWRGINDLVEFAWRDILVDVLY